jgi:predicted phosphoadenosine phosphosulfate sulfurtransferase
VEDVWTYNGKFNKPYNTIYDMFYRAGVPLWKMRICEPYGREQRAGLYLFKVLEPDTWLKVVDRVSGANFGNIYCNTKAIGVRSVDLPKGHTWRTYCKFLLRTLPEETRKIYMTKFIKFIRYWNRVGSPVSDEEIRKLDPEIIINTYTYGNRGKKDKYLVKFRVIPDVLPGLDNRTDFLSWRRMCMAILKNDIICSSLSFSITKRQIIKQQELIEKYRQIV